MLGETLALVLHAGFCSNAVNTSLEHRKSTTTAERKGVTISSSDTVKGGANYRLPGDCKNEPRKRPSWAKQKHIGRLITRQVRLESRGGKKATPAEIADCGIRETVEGKTNSTAGSCKWPRSERESGIPTEDYQETKGENGFRLTEQSSEVYGPN